jgi:proteasome lid subunit RPN8/RPN11
VSFGVSPEVRQVLVAEARSAHPQECCGILLGEGTHITAIQSAVNVHPTPETHFEIDPQALVDAHRSARKGGPQVIGYYHSHPTGSAVPSATDRAMAAGDGRIWAIIGSDGEVAFWRDEAKGFEALSYSVSSS